MRAQAGREVAFEPRHGGTHRLGGIQRVGSGALDDL